MSIRMLCIDDSLDSIVITKRVLERAKGAYQIDSASNGQEGLSKLRLQSYDLILCDYRLPGMSGVDVLQQLKVEGRDVPVVIVTAAGSERVAVEAMKVGAYDYVVKDALYEELLPSVIERTLERHREKQERKRMESERDEALATLQREKAALQHINAIMMDREGRILELKQEVNALLEALCKPKKYQV